MTIRVVVAGSNGRMGQILVAGLPAEADIKIVGTIEIGESGERVLADADVMVEFTHVDAAFELMLRAIKAGVRPVSGTSGLPEAALDQIDAAARAKGIGAVWAANFRTAGALLAHFASIAARHLDAVEIVEIMHATKKDAPSGVSLAVAKAIAEARNVDVEPAQVERQTLPGTRGGALHGVHIHSVRLPGLLSRTNVYFSDVEEVLAFEHFESGRQAYPKTVARAVRKVMEPDIVGLIRGYGAVIGLETFPHPDLEKHRA